MAKLFKIFKLLIVVSIFVFIFSILHNPLTLNIIFVLTLVSWIIIQVIESKSPPAFDILLILQILSEIFMIVLSLIMILN